MRIQSEALWPSTTQKKYVNTKPGRWDRYHPGDKRLRSGSQEAWESRNRHYGERNLLPFPGPHSHQPPQGNQGTKIPNLLLWPQNRWTNLHLVSRGHKGPALLRTEKKEIREPQSRTVYWCEYRWKGLQRKTVPAVVLCKTCCFLWLCPGKTLGIKWAKSTGFRTFSVSKTNKTRKNMAFWKDCTCQPTKPSSKWFGQQVCSAPKGNWTI